MNKAIFLLLRYTKHHYKLKPNNNNTENNTQRFCPNKHPKKLSFELKVLESAVTFDLGNNRVVGCIRLRTDKRTNRQTLSLLLVRY